MWIYEKKLQFPVDIRCKDLRLAKALIAQYGGPAGELSACLQYLDQRFTMPTGQTKALLTDIGTEELGHLEMVGSIVHQLTRSLTEKQMQEGGFAPYFVDHSAGVYPTAASGFPSSCAAAG